MITSTDRGIVIDVRVIPRAGRAGIAGTRDGALLVRLNAPPVEGAANAELVQVLADALGVPKRNVAIINGTSTRRKRIEIFGVTAEHAASRLPH